MSRTADAPDRRPPGYWRVVRPLAPALVMVGGS